MRRGLGATTALRAVALVGLVTLVGCDDRDGGHESSRPNTPKFPHKTHVVDEEMKCQNCHTRDGKSDVIVMPALQSCKKCHEAKDEKKPPERRVSAFEVNGQPVWRHVTKQNPDVKFDHAPHLKARVACTSCHKGIENSKELSSSLALKMNDCRECHAKVKMVSGVTNECALCHKTISRDQKPANHLVNWKQLHGKAIGFMNKTDVKRCDTCHTQDWCLKCHRQEKPQNHTNYWRDRGHNVTAELDRQSCRTCHADDFCAACHRKAAPRVPYERGGFHRVTANSLTRCTECHFQGDRGRKSPHRWPGAEHECLSCHRVR